MAKPLPPIANRPTEEARRLVERIVEHVRLIPAGDAREPGAVDRLAVAVDLFVAERLAAAKVPPPAGGPHPVVAVTVEITLRDFGDLFAGRPLPANLTDAALADAATRLVTDGQYDGRLVTTTLWHDPKDRDSDAIESVGGSLRVAGVQVRR